MGWGEALSGHQVPVSGDVLRKAISTSVPTFIVSPSMVKLSTWVSVSFQTQIWTSSSEGFVTAVSARASPIVAKAVGSVQGERSQGDTAVSK